MTASDSNRSRIGIFGGSFNPPHAAHLIVAEFIRDQFDLERILWIPSYNTPLKAPEDLAPMEDRFEMTRLATCDNDRFEVSDVEIRRGGFSFTVDTLRGLQEARPEIEFSLIVGMDNLREFASWREPDEILRRVPLIVYPRKGSDTFEVPRGISGSVSIATAPLVEISGTMIRERIRQGRSIRYMVPSAVERHLRERRLYLRGEAI
ncbi:MAG: nicotinate-nucleotide adenylyltransferase [Rhodothermales bacterium]